MTSTIISKRDAAELKQVQAIIDSDDLERAQAAEGRARRAYHARCEAVPDGSRGTDPELLKLLEEVDAAAALTRRRAAVRRAAIERHAELDRRLRAPERVKAKQGELQQSKAAEAVVQRRLDDDADAKVVRLHTQRDSKMAAVAAEQARRADAYYSDVPQPRAAGDTPGAQDHALDAQAIAAAIERAESEQAALRAELTAAKAAVKEAADDLMQALAACAELAHAEALAAYLPALAAFIGAHRAAFDGDNPSLPDVADLGLDMATELADSGAATWVRSADEVIAAAEPSLIGKATGALKRAFA